MLQSNVGTGMPMQAKETYGSEDYGVDELITSSPITESEDWLSGGESMLEPEPERTEDDYRVEVKSLIFETLGKTGTADNVDVSLELFSKGKKKKSGHGKAFVEIGKDLKTRRFEIPITLKDDKFTFGKVKDLDTEEYYEISDKSLFMPPSKDTRKALLERAFENGDYGKDWDADIKSLEERFGSADEGEIKAFVNDKKEQKKKEFWDKVEKYGTYAVVGLLGVFGFYYLNYDKGEAEKEVYGAADDELYEKFRQLSR